MEVARRFMSTFTKAKTRAQLRHPGSRDPSHQKDKLEGERRRQLEYIPVPAALRPSPERSFPGLVGHEYRYDGCKWERCVDPKEFGDYLEEQAKLRNWYKKWTTRKGVPVEMRRSVKAPIEVLTTTFSPWLSDYISHQIASGSDPKPQLAQIRNKWIGGVLRMMANSRYVLGYAFHSDTSDGHLDVVCSRQSPDGDRIGKSGLGLGGPWLTATDRQIRSGGVISRDKARKYEQSMLNFRRREGAESLPLDVRLARSLDAAADTVLGETLVPYREAYARSIPALERGHRAARLAELDYARSRLLEGAAEPMSPELDHLGPAVAPSGIEPTL